jgi:transcriptional regulator with XRE-family HTH domain
MKALDTYFKQERGRMSRVSEQTGLSTGFLSQIASGDRTPGLESLMMISKATKIPAEELIASIRKPRKRKQREVQ